VTRAAGAGAAGGAVVTPAVDASDADFAAVTGALPPGAPGGGVGGARNTW